MESKVVVDYRFTKHNYATLCGHATKGELSKIKEMIGSIPEEDHKRFGPETFCPDPRRHLKSPVVLACQYGHLDVVKYFLEEFPNITDINKGASIISKTQKIETHNISPLIAACTNDNIELVKYLISHGADIHKRSLTRAVPLRAAAYYGYLGIMEYLIQCGAELNVANCIGSSPLLAAAHNGGAKATKLLLDKGCNVSQKTIEGYTAMHEAAQKGETEVIKVLLDYGMSPLFATSKPGIKDYVPCPLYLAASVGKRSVVDFLIEREDCPLQCKCDAYLLLAIAKIEYPDVADNHKEDALQLWLKGLEASEIENDELTSLSSKYLNHTEIRSAEHLQKLWDTQTFKLVDIYFQCLLIRERCMGLDDQSLIECLLKRGAHFLRKDCYKECECVWERAMEVEENICEAECSHPEYGYCDGIQKDLRGDLQDYMVGVQYMIHANYTPNFQRYMQFAVRSLGFLERLRDKADGEVVDNFDMISISVRIMLLWLLNQAKLSIASKSEFYLPPIFTSLCVELVSNFLFHPKRYNLLHFVFWNLQELIYFANYDNTTIAHILKIFIEAVMKAGGERCLNMVDKDGTRLLHIASKQSLILKTGEYVSTLIEWGAHIDAVDYLGQTAAHPKYCLRNSPTYSYFLSLGPSPLFCYAARTIVREHFPYQTLGLPNHIVSFVKLHDPQFACKEKELIYFSVEINNN